MSTADSQLLVSGSAIAYDLGIAEGSPKTILLVSRCTIIFLAIAAVLMTILLPEKIFSRVLSAWMALGATFGPSLIARLAGLSIRPISLLLSMVAGFFLTVILSIFPDTTGDILERLLPFFVASVILRLSQRGNQ